MNNRQRSTLAIYSTAFFGLLQRDVHVLRRSLWSFIIRTIINPMMFAFVFTYLLPKLGQGVNSGNLTYGTILLPGLIGVAIFTQGITAVAVPLAVELGTAREIDDRLVAPLPISMVAAEKIAFSALQSITAGLVTFPLVYIIPAGPIQLHLSNWLVLAGIVLLAALAAGGVGLSLGTLVKPQQISVVFVVILTPITFLGCVYYPWALLSRVPLLQKFVLLNPLVYICEGLRGALTSRVPHLPIWGAFAGLFVVFIVTSYIGTKGFLRRVVN